MSYIKNISNTVLQIGSAIPTHEITTLPTNSVTIPINGIITLEKLLIPAIKLKELINSKKIILYDSITPQKPTYPTATITLHFNYIFNFKLS